MALGSGGLGFVGGGGTVADVGGVCRLVGGGGVSGIGLWE